MRARWGTPPTAPLSSRPLGWKEKWKGLVGRAQSSPDLLPDKRMCALRLLFRTINHYSIEDQMKFAALVFCSLLLVGCMGNKMSSWEGKHRDDLIQKWGPPSQETALKKEGQA